MWRDLSMDKWIGLKGDLELESDQDTKWLIVEWNHGILQGKLGQLANRLAS